MEKPKTYKESFERVCEEYARYKVYSKIKVYGLCVVVFILLIIVYGLLVFVTS